MMWAMPGTHEKEGGEEESELEPRTLNTQPAALPSTSSSGGILLFPFHWLRWGQEAGGCACVLNHFSLSDFL